MASLPNSQQLLSTTSKRAVTLFDEFRAFALKGNVIDLAVGVMIGAAFTKIVDSLVRHIMMPLMAALLPGDQGYLGLKFVIGGSEVPYGLFLGEVINFLIIAGSLFLFIRVFLTWALKVRKQETPPPPPSKEQELLTEIRDLLKNRPAVTT
jgi:large conductance mechanosensitive channel